MIFFLNLLTSQSAGLTGDRPALLSAGAAHQYYWLDQIPPASSSSLRSNEFSAFTCASPSLGQAMEAYNTDSASASACERTLLSHGFFLRQWLRAVSRKPSARPRPGSVVRNVRRKNRHFITKTTHSSVKFQLILMLNISIIHKFPADFSNIGLKSVRYVYIELGATYLSVSHFIAVTVYV